MRVVKEVTLGEIRVSIFSWNSKYIFKYELGPMEQTFKVTVRRVNVMHIRGKNKKSRKN